MEIIKKYSPKSKPSVPVGKIDNSGKLITNHEGLGKKNVFENLCLSIEKKAY